MHVTITPAHMKQSCPFFSIGTSLSYMIALFTQAKGHSKLGVDLWNISYFNIIAEKSDI